MDAFKKFVGLAPEQKPVDQPFNPFGDSDQNDRCNIGKYFSLSWII